MEGMNPDWVLSDDKMQAKAVDGSVQLKFVEGKNSCTGCYFMKPIPVQGLPCARGSREDERSGIWQRINH